jgi:hypothetical protein
MILGEPGPYLAAIALVLAGTAGCKRSPPPAARHSSTKAARAPLGKLHVAIDWPILQTPAGGALEDGTILVDARLRPLAPDLIPIPLQEGARIELANGAHWVLTVLEGKRRWMSPAHSRAEIDRREAEFVAEAKHLPWRLATRVAVRLRLLATVSVAEGDFEGIATHQGDPAASLGIFQWATSRRHTVDRASSLARLFGDLKRRAADGSSEGDFYDAAWRQCTSVGLDIRGGRLLFQGRPTTGAQLERVLSPVMGTGTLRTYQLVAADDWIERIASMRVRVGSQWSTVGEQLRSDRALATAVLLGVNRPAFVVPSLEHALGRTGNGGEDGLVWELRHQALGLYPARERERRAMRLLTSEMGW